MACACYDTKGNVVYTLCAGQDGGNNVQVMGSVWCCTPWNKIPVEDVCADGCLDSDSWCGGVKDDGNKDDYYGFKYGDEDLRNVSSIEINESALINLIKRTLNEVELGGRCNCRDGRGGVWSWDGACVELWGCHGMYCDCRDDADDGNGKTEYNPRVNYKKRTINESQLLTEDVPCPIVNCNGCTECCHVRDGIPYWGCEDGKSCDNKNHGNRGGECVKDGMVRGGDYYDFKYGDEDLRNVSSIELNEMYGDKCIEDCSGSLWGCSCCMCTEYGDSKGCRDCNSGSNSDKSQLKRLIKKTINESQLLTEKKLGGSCKRRFKGEPSAKGVWSIDKNGNYYCSLFGWDCPDCTANVVPGNGKTKYPKEASKHITMKESELINIIRRTINESQLLHEGVTCKGDEHTGPNIFDGFVCSCPGDAIIDGPSGTCKGGSCICSDSGMVSTDGPGKIRTSDVELAGCCTCPDSWLCKHSCCPGAYNSTRAMNESQILLEKETCKDDSECKSTEMCNKKCNPSACCVPICSKRYKDCGPLSVIHNDSTKTDIAERYEDYPPSDTGKKKYYCVMKGHDCWELDPRDQSAKGHKGYRSEKKCNKNC